MKIIDLHTHSNYSDGTFSPSELIALAKSTGLSAIALTDHDTADGTDEAVSAGKDCGIEVVCGIELAAEYKGAEIHILGYLIDYKGEYFIGKLEELYEIRQDRNERLLKRLNSIGLSLTEDELRSFSGRKTVTRLHFAKAMAAKGYAKSVSDAYDRYLDVGRPAFVGRNAFSSGECIEIIDKAGGVSVLAHPYSYRWAGGEVIHMLEQLKAEGLRGVEAIYPAHSVSQTSALIKAAERLGLIITGGSDFHGANRPGIKLGTGADNIRVEYGLLETLKEKR